MCGIAGCYIQNGQIDKERFEKMVDIIEHRGPNDRGTYYDGKLALGHRRLSVIDLSKDGTQPFHYMDRYVTVFNGEIYNYQSLKERLIQKGYHFNSKTDTEVLTAMYDCYGAKCVDWFNGMWSFAIYDIEEQQLFCSRDRFGVKPFYYYYQDGKFLFASEIKQFFTMLDENPKANQERLLEFILLGEQDQTDETMFKDIYQLLGGYNIQLELRTGTMEIDKYYDLKDQKFADEEITDNSYQTSCQEFLKQFHDSIDFRLKADVPVGYCLSGGLDSSAIVSMTNVITKERSITEEQHTVSSCFTDKRYDEQEYIDEVVKQTGVTAHKVFPEFKELFEKVDDIIWHMDEPFGTTSIFAQWKVFEIAKEEQLTVMLDGQGADEQLAGYSGFYSVIFAYYLRKFDFKSFHKELTAYKTLRATTEKQISSTTVILSAILSAYFPQWIKEMVANKARRKQLSEIFSKQTIDRVLQRTGKFPVAKPDSYIYDCIKYEIPSLLHFEDRDSMAHSIESRVPFLDKNLVEAIYNMPMEYKIQNGRTKAVMRDSLKGILPEKIANRYSKLGFVAPEDQWVNANQDLFQRELKQACDQLNGLLDEELIMKWYQKKKGNINRGDSMLWRIICAGRWAKVFQVQI